MSVIAATNLVKRYGATRALDAFSLHVEPGQIVGLIGPNGSGKTTALNALLGLCRCDSGDLSVLGRNPMRERCELMRRVSYIADTGILPRWMRVIDLIRFVDDVQPLFDSARAKATLERTRVDLNQRVRTLSKGMAVQVHLALVLSTESELMVLDEPTLGLDLIYRQAFYDQLLSDYFAEERSIVITTHEVAEVERILTDVVFVHNGRVVLSSAMDSLQTRFSSVIAGPGQLSNLQALEPISVRQTLGGTALIFDGADPGQLGELGAVSSPSLSELFLAVIGAQSESER